MNTTENKPFDYRTYMQANAPPVTKIHRGTDARRQRLSAALEKTSVRIERDLIARFKQLATADQDFENLINQALREWLTADGIKELLRQEIQQLFQKVYTTYQPEMTAMKVADKDSSDA